MIEKKRSTSTDILKIYPVSGSESNSLESKRETQLGVHSGLEGAPEPDRKPESDSEGEVPRPEPGVYYKQRLARIHQAFNACLAALRLTRAEGALNACSEQTYWNCGVNGSRTECVITPGLRVRCCTRACYV